MQQWREAAVALAQQKAHELRTMTDDEARTMTRALLELGASLPIAPGREMTSGLVTQQSLFHSRAGPKAEGSEADPG